MSETAINRIVLSLLCLLSCMGFGSCVYESIGDCPEAPAVETQEGEIYLTLNIGIIDSFGNPCDTRATDYYYEEPVRPNEILRSLSIFIADSHGVLEGVRRVTFSEQGVMEGSKITFSVKPGLKHIYLLGNTESLPTEISSIIENLKTGDQYPTTLNDLILIREQMAPFFTGDQWIPMAESFEITLTKPNDAHNPLYIYKNLFITRIAVKYTFISYDDIEKLMIRLPEMATKQYLMPHGVRYFPAKNEPAELIGAVAGRNITEFLSPATESDLQDFEIELTGKTVIELTGKDGQKIQAYRYDPIYLMETPGVSFMVSASVDKGLRDEQGNIIQGDWLEARMLPNLPLLPRNTHVVVRMSYDTGINLAVDLVPYRGCVLEPYFGLEIPSDTPEPTP